MAASTRSIHSRQRAAGGRSTSSTSRGSSPSRRRRRAAAVIGRTAGTSGRPESSRAAPSATSRSNSRRAARSVIGAWRAASAGRDAILGEQQVDDFGRRFGAQFGRDGDQGVGAAGEIGGEVEGGGGGEGDRAGGGVRPGGVAGPRPPSPVRPQSWGPEFSWRSAAGAAASAAGWRWPRSNTQRARISASAAGASGKAEKAKAAAFAAAGDRIALPCASLQAGREAVRVRQSQVEPRRRGGEPAWVEAGRPGGEVAPQPEQLRRGPELLANGEAQVAQRAFVGVEAQDLGGGGGALKRQAGAQRPGGGRVAAQNSVEQREPGAGEEQGIALPCPSARPRPGRDRAAGDGKVCWSKRLAAVLVAGAGRPRRCESALAEVGDEVWNEGESRRESPAHGESSAALCHLLRRRIRPACRGVAMSDKLALSDMIRKPAQTPCQTPQNQALSPT